MKKNKNSLDKSLVIYLKDLSVFKLHVVNYMANYFNKILDSLKNDFKDKAFVDKDNLSFGDKKFFEDNSGLNITVSVVNSPKKFNKDKAKDFLLKKLGKKDFDRLFTVITLRPKIGVNPPSDLLAEIEKYFDVNFQSDINENFKERLIFSNIMVDDYEIENSCFDSYPVVKLNTDAKFDKEYMLKFFKNNKKLYKNYIVDNLVD